MEFNLFMTRILPMEFIFQMACKVLLDYSTSITRNGSVGYMD